ncbi:MAG: pyridoxamine 5'-phosphate oxidase family protein [Desulfobacteraceae bacterium]|nr:pyridoxamine 5'-phosphate oxidase family protein [Desulfobacteraceae bacterium]
MDELKTLIINKMRTPTVAALATITKDGKPWVRYVTPFADNNLTIWCATFAGTRKTGQIINSPEIHLTLGVSTPENLDYYLQIQGRAEVLTDDASKQAVWGDHLVPMFTGPDDPNLNVIKITPYRIEIQEAKPVPPKVWEA